MAPAAAIQAPLREEVMRRAAEVRAIVERHRMRNPRLFGSAMRGDDHAGSDIDILVDYGERCGLFNIAAGQIELEALFGRPVDIVSPDELHPAMRDRVVATSLPI